MDQAAKLAIQIEESELIYASMKKHFQLNSTYNSVVQAALEGVSKRIEALKAQRMQVLDTQVKLLRRQRSEPLYLDDKPLDDLLALEDKDSVIFNLHEDSLCLREEADGLRESLVDAMMQLSEQKRGRQRRLEPGKDEGVVS